MSVLAAVRAGRRIAESLMLDAARVESVTTTTNPTTGAAITTYTQVYSGRCKVQASGIRDLERQAGSATYTVQRSEVHFPVGAFVPAIRQVVTVTAAQDPLLVGLAFRVTALLHKSQATAYRLGVTEMV